MPSYVERYEHEHPPLSFWGQQEVKLVWAELVAYQHAVREEPLYRDAKLVAQAMMERARHNIELLVSRLQTLDYQFALPRRVWIPPNADTAQKLDTLEHVYGPMPIVLRTWFEVVGTVDFTGAHPKLSSYDGLDWDGSDLLECASDPLVVDGGILEQGHLLSPMPPYMHPNFVTLDIAPDAIFKTHESGSGSVSMVVPNGAFDGILIDPLHQWTGTFFVQHLQTSFDWGGFPGLRNTPAAAAEAAAELAFLRQGLLPLI